MIPRLLCHVRPGSVRAELLRGRNVHWAAEAEWSDHAHLVEVVAALAGRAELPSWRRSIEFVLDPALLQRRVLVDLPGVRERELTALVALTPQRYFRRSAAPLVTAGGWSGSRKARRAIIVATETPLVAALVRGATEGGLLLRRIVPQGEPGDPVLSLLPPDERARRDLRRAGWTRGIVGAAVAAWLLLGAGLWLAEVLERRRIEARLAEIDAPLAALMAAEAGADTVMRMIGRLDREALAEGEVPAILFRVASALPDSAFLTQLRVDSAGVGLAAGAARRPAAVLAALEAGAGVGRPRFEGRTARDLIAGRPVERFAIGFGRKEGNP